MGLLRNWSRLFMWYAVFAAASWLSSWFLMQWQVTIRFYVWLGIFVVFSANFVARLVGLFMPVVMVIAWMLPGLFYDLRRWEMCVWMYVGITAALLTLYGWHDSRWTPLGVEAAHDLFAEERRRRQRYGEERLPTEIRDWNESCYGQYCVQHGYLDSGDGVRLRKSGSFYVAGSF
jgi:hypothetical protein